MKKQFKLALCQMAVGQDKMRNVAKALEQLEAAARLKADVAVLPEMFNCPYQNDFFAQYAESEEHSQTLQSIAGAANEYGMYIIAGSIPERYEKKLYNTSFTLNPKGQIIARHRKVHLFDIHILGKVSFRESDTLAAGDACTVFPTDICDIGVAICYDIRFPEFFRRMALQGAKLIIVPAAFNMTTGPAHWELLVRTRSMDNQIFVAAAAPARNPEASYVSYGHSMVANPWGKVIAAAGIQEEVLMCDIDMELLDRVREELPLLQHRRPEMYDI